MADFKDEISPAVVARLADAFVAVRPDFPRDTFVAAAVDGLDRLELMARVRHVAAALRAALPADVDDAARVVAAVADDARLDGWAGLPVGFAVADAGADHPDVALPVLALLTRRFSSEFTVRPFVERHPAVTFAHLERWAVDPDEHVRRLVSETTRPRLPWAGVLRGLVADPAPTLPLLDRLHDDPSEYVRRSVANHLNDIAKDHPDLAVEVARRWQTTGTPGAAWVVRHALRTLVKKGHPGALALLGYGPPDGVRLTGLSVSPAELAVGSGTDLAFTLTATSATRVVVDYAVHHAGARGVRGPKVFKLTTRDLAAGTPERFRRTHAFREVSVRRIHPGEHRIDVLVNGRVLGTATVLVTAAQGTTA